MADADNPVVVHHRLRAELRRLREAAGLTQKEVADVHDWSATKVIRMEAGTNKIGVSDLRLLLAHYNVTGQEKVSELVGMARATKQRMWRDKYRAHITLRILPLDSNPYRGIGGSFSILDLPSPNGGQSCSLRSFFRMSSFMTSRMVSARIQRSFPKQSGRHTPLWSRSASFVFGCPRSPASVKPSTWRMAVHRRPARCPAATPVPPVR